MEQEISSTSFIILVIACQVVILLVVVLFFLYRRFKGASASKPPVTTTSRSRRHPLSVLLGAVIGVVFLGGAIYYMARSEKVVPIERVLPLPRQTRALSAHSMYPENEDHPSVAPRPQRPAPLWDAGTRFGEPRIRKIIRKTLRGKVPEYVHTRQPANPAPHSYQFLMNQWVKADGDEPRRRAYDAKKYFDRLRKEYGFRGSESTVRLYLDDLAKYGAADLAVSYPFDSSCGQEAAVHWASKNATLDGRAEQLHVFSMHSQWSGKSFSYCCSSGELDAFLDSHVRAFEFFGGIFPTLVYVHLPADMERRLCDPEDPDYADFKRFCDYFHISPQFKTDDTEEEEDNTNERTPYSWYKEMYSDVSTLKELNQRLLKACISNGNYAATGHFRTMNELFEAEKLCLLTFPKGAK